MLEFMACVWYKFDYASLGAAGQFDRDGFNTPLQIFKDGKALDAFVRTTLVGNLGLNKNGLNDIEPFSAKCFRYFKSCPPYLARKDYEKVGDATSTTKDLGSEFDFEYALTIPKLLMLTFCKVFIMVQTLSIARISLNFG